MNNPDDMIDRESGGHISDMSLAEAAGRIAAALAIHQRVHWPEYEGRPAHDVCMVCEDQDPTPWPCPTAQALMGEK